MKKFFRNFRQDSISEGNVVKYLKYALGEIVLVVIGILIALSINNWNESRKNKLAEHEYYCKLLADFDLDRKNIAQLYEECNYRINVSKKLLLELPKMDKDKSYLIDNYIQALRIDAFVPSKVTITDIISSGSLNLLTNDSLKNNIIRYYAELDKFLYQLEINQSKALDRAFAYDDDLQFGFQYSDYVKKSLGPEIMKTLPKNDWQLDSTSKYYRQFQNDLVNFVVNSERIKQHFDNILKAMEPTYNQLKAECSSNPK